MYFGYKTLNYASFGKDCLKASIIKVQTEFLNRFFMYPLFWITVFILHSSAQYEFVEVVFSNQNCSDLL